MTKIAEKDLQSINAVRDGLNRAIYEAGQLTLQVGLMEEDVQAAKLELQHARDTFKRLLEEEKALINRLSTEYGVGSIDFETGEFTQET